MTAYRRNLVAGGAYFFTLNLADRRSSLLTDNIGLLRAAFRHPRRRHPFAIDSIVILPDHLHALWTLPAGDRDFSTRWRLIKSHFSRGLPVTKHVSASRSHKRERGIWQRRFWEHTIRDDDDFARHVDYIYFRSNTAMWSESKIGRFHHSIAWCGSAAIRPNGWFVLAMSRTAAMARGNGFRSAQPILRTTVAARFSHCEGDMIRSSVPTFIGFCGASGSNFYWQRALAVGNLR
jgi:putative transposase